MNKLIDAQIDAIRLVRRKTINNAWQLLQNAVKLFVTKQYPLACFIAMTTIEEVGKLFILQIIQGDLLKIVEENVKQVPEPDSGKLRHFLRNHLEKAIQAAAVSLYVNVGADKRHGIHPKSGLHRTSGVILLARSGRWMNIRNACLYSDLDLSANLASCPEDAITPEHAYYFICMAFEIIAEQSSSGFGNSFESSDPETLRFWKELASGLKDFVEEGPGDIDVLKLIKQAVKNYSSIIDTEKIGESMQFTQDRLNDLRDFIECWSGTVNIDELEFLANPEPLRVEAIKREQI